MGPQRGHRLLCHRHRTNSKDPVPSPDRNIATAAGETGASAADAAIKWPCVFSFASTERDATRNPYPLPKKNGRVAVLVRRRPSWGNRGFIGLSIPSASVKHVRESLRAVVGRRTSIH